MGTTEAPDGRAVESGRTSALGGPSAGWIAALGLSKAADVATTVLGLRATAVLAERNPLAAAAMRELGTVPGLVVLGALTVVGIVGIVEGAFRLPLLARADGDAVDRRTGRRLCYGVASLCHAGFAVYNAALIVGIATLGA